MDFSVQSVGISALLVSISVGLAVYVITAMLGIGDLEIILGLSMPIFRYPLSLRLRFLGRLC